MSINCNINSAIPLDCLDEIGGIKTLWVSTDFDYTSFTAGATTGISSLTGGTGNFYQIALAKDTGVFNETFNISNTNGTAFFTQELTIPVQHLSSAKRAQIQLLAYNRASRVIFEDNNNLFWILGLTRGCVISTGTSTTGTAVGDANQYSFVLQGQEPQMSYQLVSLASMTGCSFINA